MLLKKRRNKRIIGIFLAATLVWPGVGAAFAPAPTKPEELVNKPYLELLATASAINLSAKEVEDFKRRLERDQEAERRRLEQEEKNLKARIEQSRKQLGDLNRRASRDDEEATVERRDLHCAILKLERDLNQKRTEREQGLPVAYDNKRAKLDLIRQWPARKKEIEQTLAAGRARARRFGDVEDIGVRVLNEGQEKDVKVGEDAIREMKAYGLMPPEVEDKELKEYVQRIAERIAANSDLKTPVKLTVLDSEEINAFALPGGFLFINTGLIEKAENESEIAGVIAHELAHAAARHGARLMKRATIASVIYQAAQAAAMIFTGGVAGVGTYYALQYGFLGLGMALNLALLGVSREYEEEADQLGVQYAWKAGYDPKGFITFFDKMASEKGYVRSASFFRTHPPFFERIVSAFSEIEYLPEKKELVADSPEFQKIKEHLKKVQKELDADKKKRPMLRRMPECDEAKATV
jgi:Zn-dependent protease with chaperone function